MTVEGQRTDNRNSNRNALSRRQLLFGRTANNADTGPAPTKPITITETCLPFKGVECRSCQDACPERAIRFTPRIGGAFLPTADTDACTTCGECVDVCPAGAIILATAPDRPSPHEEAQRP